jgi:hypothetical protein
MRLVSSEQRNPYVVATSSVRMRSRLFGVIRVEGLERVDRGAGDPTWLR